MQQHPVGKKYRAMTDEEYSGLLNDIREHGQRLQITMYQGMVLDGWHRMRACFELSKEPWTKEYSGTDPEGYCRSLNDHRRHQSPTQRVSSALEKSGTGAGFDKTEAEIAVDADVSERTVRNAKTARAAGFAEMLDAGEIDAKPAAELARKAPELAARVVAKEITPAEGKAGLKAKVKRELPTVAAPDLKEELFTLNAELMDMRAELIELRAASHDERLRAQARDEIQGLREALELEQQLHAALKAQRETMEYQLNDWKKRCASLVRQIERRGE